MVDDNESASQALTAQPDGDRQAAQPERWALIRDAVQFQIKLAIDGLRDLMLMPLSAIGALLNLFGVTGTPLDFYKVVRWGKQTEKAINLFSAAQRHGEGEVSDLPASVDSMFDRVESMVLEQYRRGGITAAAKDAIDKALDNAEAEMKR